MATEQLTEDLARTARARIEVDHLADDYYGDCAGTVFRLCRDTWGNTTPISDVDVKPFSAKAYDDDHTLYYDLRVFLPDDDVLAETALESLLNQMESYAGVTHVWFPGHPELDVG